MVSLSLQMENSRKIDFWIFQTNNGGELIWEKSYGGFSSDYGSTIVEAKERFY